MSDKPIIPGLSPEPTKEDRDNYDLIVNTPDEAGAREVADLRVRATRAGIEWAAQLIAKMDECAVGHIEDALAAHDASMD